MKLLVLLLLNLPLNLFSQEVLFCEAVDKSGNVKNASKEFTIGNDGGFIKILLKLNKAVESNNVVYDVYKVYNGKEFYDNTIRMDIKPDLTWFFKEITFFKAGDYRVYIYDERDKLIGLGEVKIYIR